MNALTRFTTDTVGLRPGLTSAFLLVASALLIGSLLRVIRLYALKRDSAKWRQRLGSLAVWWVGLGILGLIAYFGMSAGVIVFAAASALGLHEYFRMLDRFGIANTGRLLAFLAIPFTYGAIYFRDDVWFFISVPVVMFLLFAAQLVAAGKTAGYLTAVSSMTWGTILLVFFVAHAVRLLDLSPTTNPVGGVAGWLVYLVILTECDDIFQALWGRRFGRNKITPQISPNKSLEGLVGGVLSTVVVGIVLAPWLTPLLEPLPRTRINFLNQLPWIGAVLASVLISLAGFLGDLNMSALKRDAGVKDTGDLLPSQGGLLDRIDSLTFTAPVFYYFVRYLYG